MTVGGAIPIKYVWPVGAQINWARSWLKDYTGMTDDKMDRVFSSKQIINKYSKNPPPNLKSEEIRKITSLDAEEFAEKVKDKLDTLNTLNDKQKKKIMSELPSGNDLFNIWMSYRIHNTVGKQRIRIPTETEIINSNYKIKLNNI